MSPQDLEELSAVVSNSVEEALKKQRGSFAREMGFTDTNHMRAVTAHTINQYETSKKITMAMKLGLLSIFLTGLCSALWIGIKAVFHS